MRRALAALAVVVVLCAVSGDASAVEFRLFGQPLRLDLTESLYLNYHGPTGTSDATAQNYGELLNRLNVQIAWKRFLFGVRFDSAGYVHTPQPGDRVSRPDCPNRSDPNYNPMGDPCLVKMEDPRLINRFQNRPFFIEKIFFTYAGRDLDVTLGDSYVNFGRGLVLSIRKLDELGIDTTLRGGKVALRLGEFSGVATAGWTNIQNIDEASAYYTDGHYNYDPHAYDPRSPSYEDPYKCLFLVVGCSDFIAGLHLDYRLFHRVLLGAQAMYGSPSRQQVTSSTNSLPADHYLRAGALLDAPRLTDWLALYVEYAFSEDQLSGKPSHGDAFYAAATVYTHNAVFLFEYKDYRNYLPWHSSVDPRSPVSSALVYMQPPTLERVITQITNNTDIVAGRVRSDFHLSDAALVFASIELGQLHPTPDSTDRLVDLYGGAELRWNQGRSHFFPLLGYRREDSLTENRLEEELIAIEWDGAQALPHGWSIETQGLVWLRSKPLAVATDNRWREGNVYLSLKWAPRFVIAAGWEFTTLEKEQKNQHDFFNGSLQWNITPATSLRLFAGGNRPGLKCISGVCRDFPAFQGAKLEFVLRL